jgi:hypothetical protein
LFSYPNLHILSPIIQGNSGDTMSQSKWNKPIKQYETKIKKYDTKIKELSLKQKNLTKRLRGLKRLESGNNIHLIRGEKYDRLKILWLGKGYWFHLPKPKGDEGVVDDGVVSKITSKFMDDILSGKI